MCSDIFSWFKQTPKVARMYTEVKFQLTNMKPY